jgi:hypothetical protein
MEPGDTLNVSAIGHQTGENNDNQYVDTKHNGYFSAEMNKSAYFSGRAAYNTILSNELDQYRFEYIYEDNVDLIIKKVNESAKAVNQLIDSYRGKASNKCIDYFQNDFKYYLAAYKLYCNAIQGSSITFIHGNKAHLMKVDYPEDFFLDVDTLSILMNPNEWNSSYQNYIYKAQIFKQNRLGRSVRKNASQNFMENYYFSIASLKGYPLYQQIAYYIDSELRRGSDINLVKPYYNNFLNNCGDPALTEPLKRVYTTAQRFEIGNKFKTQIKNLLSENNEVEKNELLQERISKGSAYFLEKIENDFFPAIRNLHTDSDNKAVKKLIKEAIDKIHEDILIKIACLNACINGFSQKAYLETRATASIEKPEKSEKTERFDKVDFVGTETIKHPELLSLLKSWRNDKADDSGLPHYMVLQQKAIASIAFFLPQTLAELINIKGIGKRKAAAYGEEIIKIVSEYCNKNNVVREKLELQPRAERKAKPEKGAELVAFLTKKRL